MEKGYRLWIILAVVVVVLIIGGLLLRNRVAARSRAEETRTAVVERGTLRVTVTTSGRIEPEAQVDLSFDLPGRVAEVAVDLGDVVHAGQPLARLETEDLERAVAQAELSLRQAQLRLERLQEPADETEVRQAQHAVDQAAAALEVAQINLTTVLSSTLLNEALEDAREVFEDARNRYQDRLAEYERGEIDYWFVDQAHQRYEDAQLALTRLQQQADLQVESARNEVERARQSYQEAQDRLQELLDGADPRDVEAAQLDVEAARLALEKAQSDLEKATLVAPFDGVVSAVNIAASEAAPTGLPAISLVDPTHFRITTSVDEIDVAKLKVGLPVEVTADALPDLTLTGTVECIGPAATVDQGAVSYPVVILLDPTDAPLRAGMSATAIVMVEELIGQLLIPNWVVRINQTTGQPYVYRQTDDGLEQVNVRLGIRYEGYSQVLDGVEEGDVLVLVREPTNGLFRQP
ncbi:MAG TPA: HlyD family secretion protein [Anaerolineales bacterium]|nr:HlyD family secretion protein [Anaerolineae bacterium]HIQ01274.1 HlyD family secretion protein [Anaerolineales bacterium]